MLHQVRSILAVATVLATVVPSAALSIPVTAPHQRSAPDEKESRTPAQQKINSQILYEIYRLRGEAEMKGVPAGKTGVRVDKDGRALVDVRVKVTQESERPCVMPARDHEQVRQRRLHHCVGPTGTWRSSPEIRLFARSTGSRRHHQPLAANREECDAAEADPSPPSCRRPLVRRIAPLWSSPSRRQHRAGFSRVRASAGPRRAGRLDIAPEALAQIDALIRDKESRSPIDQEDRLAADLRLEESGRTANRRGDRQHRDRHPVRSRRSRGGRCQGPRHAGPARAAHGDGGRSAGHLTRPHQCASAYWSGPGRRPRGQP